MNNLSIKALIKETWKELINWFKKIMAFIVDIGALLFIGNHQIKSDAKKQLNPTKERLSKKMISCCLSL
jgi:hypothetical protein